MLIKFILVFISFLFISGEIQDPYQWSIAEARSNTDTKIFEKIKSIEVVQTEQMGDICGRSDAIGCTWSYFNPATDELTYSEIYISNLKNYTGCKTFKRVLYHEIGHVSYNYQFSGNIGNTSVREAYADEYANRFIEDMC